MTFYVFVRQNIIVAVSMATALIRLSIFKV